MTAKSGSGYWWENETKRDVERMQQMHVGIKATMGNRLVVAPIDLTTGGLRILDSGTADGFWLRDFDKDHPGHTLVGTDIATAKFPSDLPDNLTLVKQDLQQEWPEDWNGTFDFVHQRLTLIPACRGDPRPTAEKLFKLVKPGGWIQLMEQENIIGEDDGPAMRQFFDLMTGLLSAKGLPLHFAKEMPTWLEEAGFGMIGSYLVPVCCGAKYPFPDTREEFLRGHIVSTQGMVDVAKRMPNLKGISKEDLETLIPRLDAECRERGGYFPFRVVWGRKPL